jgi:allantoate deiminase
MENTQIKAHRSPSEIGGEGSALTYARVAMERCDTLGRISEEPECLTRRCATPALRQVNEIVKGWMREAGMAVREDNIGNLIGRYDADDSQAETQNPGSTLLLGSHLDTVRDAGKYDGPLGVMCAIACVQRLHDRNEHLPFAIEVVAFADEEGLRYHTAYLGSKVFTGAFEPHYLELKDADGIVMADAIRSFGGDPDALPGDRWSGGDLLGYVEVHIEQGPMLEELRLPVGVVSGISGQTRANLHFKGEAGHAGTVPMKMRRDALCAASEFVLEVEAYARSHDGLQATVGQVHVYPGASNVIPGSVTLSLDVRHIDDAKREQACNVLRDCAGKLCRSREVHLDWRDLQHNPAIACSSRLSDNLAAAVKAAGHRLHRLPSGAGHDAVTLSKLTDVAMLFVRCKGGISHNPAESVEINDVAVAIDVMARFVDALAKEVNA